MKETIIRCNECGSEITGGDPPLTFNGEEIDLCSEQCRLKWWIMIVNEAQTTGHHIHITSQPEQRSAEQSNALPERNVKMFPRK